MHCFLSRANSLAAYSLTVLGGVMLLCFLSTFFLDYRKQVTLDSSRIIVKSISNYNTDRRANDLGHLTLDIDADLNSLFNWNVKQLFVYLYAEYETSSNHLNQVILWDKIIKRGESAHLKHKQLNAKYYFWDDGAGLRGNNVTLHLAWNVIPNAGCLPHIGAIGEYQFSFPDQYTVSKQ